MKKEIKKLSEKIYIDMRMPTDKIVDILMGLKDKADENLKKANEQKENK